MSKGLSRQQFRILGLTVAVSRMRNDAPRAYQPQSHPDWNVPVVLGVLPDLTVRLAAHVLGGCVLRPRPSWLTKVTMETTPAAFSARSEISRAIPSLLRRQLLA